MTSFYVRLGEANKTPAQIEQREKTYEAAKSLRALGYEVEVLEWFTGDAAKADAAGIILKLEQFEANREGV